MNSKIINFSLFSIVLLLASTICAGELTLMLDGMKSDFSEKFLQVKSSHIELLDGFLSLYNEDNSSAGQFPKYEFTTEQFRAYLGKYMKDYESPRPPARFLAFMQMAQLKNYRVEKDTPEVLRYFVGRMLIDLPILQHYQHFLRERDATNAKLADAESLEELKKDLQKIIDHAVAAQKLLRIMDANGEIQQWQEDFIVFMTYRTGYSFTNFIKDLIEDFFFKQICLPSTEIGLAGSFSALPQPLVVDPYAPSFVVSPRSKRAIATEEAEIKEIIKSLKIVSVKQGISSYLDLNQASLDLFDQALKDAGYTMNSGRVAMKDSVHILDVSLAELRILHNSHYTARDRDEVYESVLEKFSQTKFLISFLQYTNREEYRREEVNGFRDQLRKDIFARYFAKHGNDLQGKIKRYSFINRKSDLQIFEELKNEKARQANAKETASSSDEQHKKVNPSPAKGKAKKGRSIKSLAAGLFKAKSVPDQVPAPLVQATHTSATEVKQEAPANQPPKKKRKRNRRPKNKGAVNATPKAALPALEGVTLKPVDVDSDKAIIAAEAKKNRQELAREMAKQDKSLALVAVSPKVKKTDKWWKPAYSVPSISSFMRTLKPWKLGHHFPADLRKAFKIDVRAAAARVQKRATQRYLGANEIYKLNLLKNEIGVDEELARLKGQIAIEWGPDFDFAQEILAFEQAQIRHRQLVSQLLLFSHAQCLDEVLVFDAIWAQHTQTIADYYQHLNTWGTFEEGLEQSAQAKKMVRDLLEEPDTLHTFSEIKKIHELELPNTDREAFQISLWRFKQSYERWRSNFEELNNSTERMVLLWEGMQEIKHESRISYQSDEEGEESSEYSDDSIEVLLDPNI
jgi:hypothetical protein